jgi:hypothetical protein
MEKNIHMAQQLNFVESDFLSLPQPLSARHETATLETQRLEKLNGPCILSSLAAVNGQRKPEKL